MESFNGHFKGENKSLFHEAANIWELERVIAQQMEYYNSRRRHSTLGYTAPMDHMIREDVLPQPAVDLALQMHLNWRKIPTACPPLDRFLQQTRPLRDDLLSLCVARFGIGVSATGTLVHMYSQCTVSTDTDFAQSKGWT